MAFLSDLFYNIVCRAALEKVSRTAKYHTPFLPVTVTVTVTVTVSSHVCQNSGLWRTGLVEPHNHPKDTAGDCH